MTEKENARQFPRTDGPSDKSAARGLSSPHYITKAPTSQTVFDRFATDARRLALRPWGAGALHALSRRLRALVDDAASAGDLRTLRAVRDVVPPPNPIEYETYHGQGVDLSEFAQALARRRAWARGEAARLAPSVAADDVLYQATGEGWSRE